MEINPTTDKERRRIIKILEASKGKSRSENFLDGFPWKSTKWCSLGFKHADLYRFFLFWDGIAWGKSPEMLPRRLKNGVEIFMQIESVRNNRTNNHLNQVKNWLKKYDSGKIRNDKPFVILCGVDHESRLLIIDGNHRISAAVWWAVRSGDLSKLPQKAWIGLSPKMSNYYYYSRILRSH